MGKAAGAVVVAGLGLVGLGYGGLAGEDNTTRDETGQVIDGGELGAFRIRTGDCFEYGSEIEGEIESVQGIPCSEPHDHEAFAAYNVTLPSFPGEDAIAEEAALGCYDRFEDYVGQTYEESRLDFWYMYPSEASWDQLNDREVVCVISDMDGLKLSQTVKDSGL